MDAKGMVASLIMLSWTSFGWARLDLSLLDASSSKIFNVLDYGAVGDGKTDDSKAFLKAWDAICASPQPSVLSIPSDKTFLLNSVTFRGPCSSNNVSVQISGNIVAPYHISAWKDSNSRSWVTFTAIEGLIINGNGQIDGQGSSWWKCRTENKCSSAPTMLLINSCDGFWLSGLKFYNSPQMHVVINQCTGVQISQITITAPEDSPNTDGIHIGGSKNVEIRESIIGTGDDCISIETESSYINISEIICGPGHGISVGSLGDPGQVAAVEQVSVFNCSFVKTMNGVRIKTWQGGYGVARAIKFEKISMNLVDNPIVIDQYYCDNNHECPNKTSAVKVSDVSFIGINGSSTQDVAINLSCSQTVACKDIHLENIRLTTAVEGKVACSYCLNAHGTFTDPVNPAVSCLYNDNSPYTSVHRDIS